MASKVSQPVEHDLVVPAAKLGKIKGLALDSLRVVPLHQDLLISSALQPGDREKPLLYGDLRLFHIGELMALVSSMRKDGFLTILVPHARKTIYFVGGEIVYATSNVEDDRLGEVLWRRGLLTLKQLTEVHDLVSPQKKLGAILVERRLITPRQLYDGVKEQVLEIVYSLFHLSKGEFLFVEGEVFLKGPVRLDISTREVILEGVHRVEEMNRLEESFPDRETVLVKRPVAVDADLEEPERHLLKLIDGKLSVQVLIERGHLGEYEALRSLSRLQQLGLVDIRQPGLAEDYQKGPLPEILQEYSQMLRVIHQTIKVEHPGAESRLEDYLGSPAPNHKRIFLNVGFDEDGRLDMDTLYRNAQNSHQEDARSLALDALRGLYDYGLFQAMDVLEGEVCEQMMAQIQAIRLNRGKGKK